jgi:hypothetical protein
MQYDWRAHLGLELTASRCQQMRLASRLRDCAKQPAAACDQHYDDDHAGKIDQHAMAVVVGLRGRSFVPSAIVGVGSGTASQTS